MSEFHDLAELGLNRDGESWGNLGYWKTATDYSEACRALALLLGEQAGLDRNSSVFDAGFGCGDQLLLWLEHFRVARIYGANLSHSQTAYAKKLLARNKHAEISAAIVQGDINNPDVWSATLERSHPSHVVALDCAYHFGSRLKFFGLAHRHLAPAGRLVLTDFLLAEEHETGGLAHGLLRWMLKRSKIPEANIVRRAPYLHQLQDKGYGNICILDISEQVMPALARSYQGSQRKYRAGDKSGRMAWSVRIKHAVTGRFLNWAYHRSILRYCVISAAKDL